MFQRFFSCIESLIGSSAFKNEKEGQVRISIKYVLIEIILFTLGTIWIRFKSVLPINNMDYLFIYITASASVIISLLICLAWKIDYDAYTIVYRTWYFRKYTFSYSDIRSIYTSKALRKFELTTDNIKITLFERSMSGAEAFINFAKKNTSSSVSKI